MNVPLPMFSQENPLELELTEEDVMQSALDNQSTCPDKSRSTTAGHLPHSELELLCTEATTCTPQLEAHI
jgi:hypothetical protein